MSKRRWQTSVGIWAFGAAATRFMPSGYHPDWANLSVEERVKRAVDGLGPLVNGYEFHYGTELNAGNLDRIQAALGPDHDIYAICYGLVPNPRFGQGSLINPDAGRRREALDHHRDAVDMAAAVGARYIIWPGNEGYNYPFQRDYAHAWQLFLAGLQAVVEHAGARGVTVFLEHKNSEPAMKILMRNVGMTLYIIQKLREMGTDTKNVKVNMDWQHLIMNGENLGEYAALLLAEGLMGHQHANSGWGSFDDDNMVGTQFIEQQIDIARVLIEGGYGRSGERIGFDLYPYTEDPVASVRQSVLQWEYLVEIADRMDGQALQAARAEGDAVAAYRTLYRALGLTPEVERAIVLRCAAK